MKKKTLSECPHCRILKIVDKKIGACEDCIKGERHFYTLDNKGRKVGFIDFLMCL